jgi:hypothetical protein
MRTIIKLIILVPVIVLAVLLAVANRGDITLMLDPLQREGGPSVQVPVYLVVLVAIMLGVIMGGIATWLAQGRHRRAARAARREVASLRAEADRMRLAHASDVSGQNLPVPMPPA